MPRGCVIKNVKVQSARNQLHPRRERPFRKQQQQHQQVTQPQPLQENVVIGQNENFAAARNNRKSEFNFQTFYMKLNSNVREQITDWGCIHSGTARIRNRRRSNPTTPTHSLKKLTIKATRPHNIINGIVRISSLDNGLRISNKSDNSRRHSIIKF